MKLLSAVVAVSLLSFSAFAGDVITVEVDAKMEAEVILVQNDQDKSVYVKQYGTMFGSTHVIATKNGQVLADITEPENKRDDQADQYAIQLKSKNLVRIVDRETNDDGTVNNIDSLVKAEVKKRMGGSLKSIKIESSQLEALYQEQYAASGINILKAFKLDTEKFSIESDIKIGGLDCKKERNATVLSCKQAVTLKFVMTGRE